MQNFATETSVRNEKFYLQRKYAWLHHWLILKVATAACPHASPMRLAISLLLDPSAQVMDPRSIACSLTGSWLPFQQTLLDLSEYMVVWFCSITQHVSTSLVSLRSSSSKPTASQPASHTTTFGHIVEIFVHLLRIWAQWFHWWVSVDASATYLVNALVTYLDTHNILIAPESCNTLSLSRVSDKVSRQSQGKHGSRGAPQISGGCWVDLW